jgi:hypothetical protein
VHVRVQRLCVCVCVIVCVYVCVLVFVCMLACVRVCVYNVYQQGLSFCKQSPPLSKSRTLTIGFESCNLVVPIGKPLVNMYSYMTH